MSDERPSTLEANGGGTVFSPCWFCPAPPTPRPTRPPRDAACCLHNGDCVETRSRRCRRTGEAYSRAGAVPSDVTVAHALVLPPSGQLQPLPVPAPRLVNLHSVSSLFFKKARRSASALCVFEDKYTGKYYMDEPKFILTLTRTSSNILFVMNWSIQFVVAC